MTKMKRSNLVMIFFINEKKKRADDNKLALDSNKKKEKRTKLRNLPIIPTVIRKDVKKY